MRERQTQISITGMTCLQLAFSAMIQAAGMFWHERWHVGKWNPLGLLPSGPDILRFVIPYGTRRAEVMRTGWASICPFMIPSPSVGEVGS